MQKKTWQVILIIIAIFLFKTNGYAQKDSSENSKIVQKITPEERIAKKKARRQKFLNTLPKNHNPKTATLLALLPGGGQIYNRRYWKLPIVWGGIGALGYLTISNYTEYDCFRKAYLHAVDDDPTTNYRCALDTTSSASNLKIYRNAAQTNSETFLLLSILFYGLTITDAFVDAHLMYFDIDDDLSLHIQPQVGYSFNNKTIVPSLSISIQAKAKSPLIYPVNF